MHALVHQLRSPPTPEKIRGSFIRPGFSYRAGTVLYLLELSKEPLMATPGFYQVWEPKVILENMATPRQNTEFGFAKQDSFQPFK
jgi:hypothetical protein